VFDSFGDMQQKHPINLEREELMVNHSIKRNYGLCRSFLILLNG